MWHQNDAKKFTLLRQLCKDLCLPQQGYALLNGEVYPNSYKIKILFLNPEIDTHP